MRDNAGMRREPPARSSKLESNWAMVGIVVGIAVGFISRNYALGAGICFAGGLITLVVGKIRNRPGSTGRLVVGLIVLAVIAGLYFTERI